MRSFIILILFLASSYLSGQQEKTEYKLSSSTLIEHYNNDDYQSIFDMFSKEMQDALPLEQTNAFFTGLKWQVGKISNADFVSHDSLGYSQYKTTFEKAILALNISLDEKSFIQGLFIKPYVEESNIIEAKDNQLISQDSLISEEQSKLIFDLVKPFPINTELSIAMIENGEVSYFGLTRNRDTLSPISNSTSVFEIGSITKVFTSTLLANAIVNDKLQLNDNVSNYLDFAFHNNTELSFKSLANHTSGLPRQPTNFESKITEPQNPYKDYHAKDLEAYFINSLEIPEELKGKFAYSNLGSSLLSHALSEIQDLSFDSLLHIQIFDPLNMENSTTIHSNITNELVKGLDPEGNETSNWEFSAMSGAGAILSNVEDLSKFALAQFDPNNKGMVLTQQKTYTISNNSGIGLGWHIINHESGATWHWHNGGTGGYSSSMALDIDKKNGIIILSNVSAFHSNGANIDNLCFGLLEMLDEGK